MPSKLLLCLVASLAVARVASADLQWDKTVQKAQCPENESVEFRFSFRNTGQKTVNIESVRPSCHCTTATLDKKEYAPGEKGEIVANVDTEGAIGEVHKLITVATDQATNASISLEMIIDIQRPVEVSPQFVFWRIGEKNDTRKVELKSEPAHPLQVTAVTSTNPHFTANFQTVVKGQQYEIQVTPDSTAEKQTAELTIQTDTPAEAPRAYTVHVRTK